MEKNCDCKSQGNSQIIRFIGEPMSIDFSSTMVRGLKGAPLSVLVLLMLAGQPVSAQYLEHMSGYSDKNVNSALLTLLEFGLVTRNGRYQWQIADGVKQLPLTNNLPDSQGTDSALEPAVQSELAIASGARTAPSQQAPSDEYDPLQTWETEIPGRSSSSRLTIDLKPELVNQQQLERKDPEKFRIRENLAECDRAGIREPKRSRISRLEHVTPDLIAFHVETASNTGLAIYRIEKNFRIKSEWRPRSDPMGSAAPVEEPEIQADPETAARWSEALKELQSKLRKVDFDTWVVCLKAEAIIDGAMILRAANGQAARWVNENCLAVIESVLGCGVKVVEFGKE